MKSIFEKQTVLPIMYFWLIFTMHLGVHPSLSPLLTSLDCNKVGKNQRRRMEGRPIIVYDEPDITKPSPGKLSQLTNQNNIRLKSFHQWTSQEVRYFKREGWGWPFWASRVCLYQTLSLVNKLTPFNLRFIWIEPIIRQVNQSIAFTCKSINN